MSDYSWQEQREDIKESIRWLFGADIDITPRAFAVLQAGYTNHQLDFGPIVSEINIFESLLKSSPACVAALFKSGVPIENISFPSSVLEPAPLSDSALDALFAGTNSRYFVHRYDEIREKQKLTEIDILISALEASTLGEEPNEIGSAILRAAGFKMPSWIRGTDPYYLEIWEECDEYLDSIADEVSYLTVVDPSHSLIQFALFEDRMGAIRLRPFGATDLSQLSPTPPLKSGEKYIIRGDVFQPIQTVSPEISQNVLENFEELLNSDRASEIDFQRFFEKYPFFLTGLDFSRAHPQPILHRDGESGWLIPDFFLEKLSHGWDAILDLKRPYDDLVSRRRHRVYFKQHIQNAISQLRYYREWFDNPRNRRQFEESCGITTFRPKMIIVIGRDYHFLDDIERIRLMEGLPAQLDIWTYDDLRIRARKYLGLCNK